MKNQTTTKTGRNQQFSYKDIDPAKVLGQKMARETVEGFTHKYAKPMKEFIGESAQVVKIENFGYISSVIEGLGTANMAAEILYERTGDTSGFYASGVGTASAILNDMATGGVDPIFMGLYLGVGPSEWLKDIVRLKAFYKGFQQSCFNSNLCWMGGETPSLEGVIYPKAADMCGYATGWNHPTREPIVPNVQVGDRIIGLKSSGVHVNGWTDLRHLGERQRDKGLDLFKRTLTPSAIYVNATRSLRQNGIMPSYAINVSGHGWLKFQRHKKAFTYVIEMVPVIKIFAEIQELLGLTTEKMYQKYNMGIGFVYFIKKQDVHSTQRILDKLGYYSWDMGYVKKGPRQVIIEQLNITLPGSLLNIR